MVLFSSLPTVHPWGIKLKESYSIVMKNSKAMFKEKPNDTIIIMVIDPTDWLILGPLQEIIK